MVFLFQTGQSMVGETEFGNQERNRAANQAAINQVQKTFQNIAASFSSNGLIAPEQKKNLDNELTKTTHTNRLDCITKSVSLISKYSTPATISDAQKTDQAISSGQLKFSCLQLFILEKNALEYVKGEIDMKTKEGRDEEVFAAKSVEELQNLAKHWSYNIQNLLAKADDFVSKVRQAVVKLIMMNQRAMVSLKSFMDSQSFKNNMAIKKLSMLIAEATVAGRSKEKESGALLSKEEKAKKNLKEQEAAKQKLESLVSDFRESLSSVVPPSELKQASQMAGEVTVDLSSRLSALKSAQDKKDVQAALEQALKPDLKMVELQALPSMNETIMKK